MADITAADFKYYRSQVVDETASNGGPMDENAEQLSGVAQNFFPTVFSADRASGKTWWRKVFCRVENSENKVFAFAYQSIPAPTVSPDDYVIAIDGELIQTQGDITGTEDHYGTGTLNATVTAGATSVDVLVEPGIPVIFRDTGVITIADTTNIEQKNITGAPSAVGDVWTLTLDTPLANGYSSTDTTVSSAISKGDIKGEFTNVSVISAAGTYDHNQATVNSIGAVDDFLTFQFTSATGFDASGPVVGSLGSGNVGSTFAPVNPNTGTAYFSIPAAAWGGTFVAADQVTQTMKGAIMAMWMQRVLSPGAAVTGGNQTGIRAFGESADA